jgi:hypothetical protein
MNSSEVGPRGIGGWLALRILQILLLTPAFLIIQRTRGLHGPQFWLSSAVTALGIATGVSLLAQKLLALELVKVHLLLQTFLAFYVAYVDLRVTKLQHPGPALTVIGTDIALYIAWFLYFRVSHRVRNTYGRNL